jgi:hypothetical protein
VKVDGTQPSPLPDQDLRFQFRIWTIERIGWAAMLAILLIASAGLFGHGPIGVAAIEHESLHMEYERFGRYHAPMNLRFTLGPVPQEHGRLTIWLPNRYLIHMRIVGIVPQPERMDVSSDGLRFIFSAEKEPSTSLVVFHLHPDTVGAMTGSFALNDNRPISFHQFIYP